MARFPGKGSVHIPEELEGADGGLPPPPIVTVRRVEQLWVSEVLDQEANLGFRWLDHLTRAEQLTVPDARCTPVEHSATGLGVEPEHDQLWMPEFEQADGGCERRCPALAGDAWMRHPWSRIVSVTRRP